MRIKYYALEKKFVKYSLLNIVRIVGEVIYLKVYILDGYGFKNVKFNVKFIGGSILAWPFKKNITEKILWKYKN